MSDARKNILVVEDDNDSRQALCLILEALGVKAVACASAKEALAAIKLHKFDLAMIDIMMPEMNGYELLKEMRKMPECSAIPVIMVTAKDKDSEVLDGYSYGADYYITKPYTSRQIEYGLKLYLEV